MQGLCKAYVREYPPKICPYMVQYLHFRILKFPLKYVGSASLMSMAVAHLPTPHDVTLMNLMGIGLMVLVLRKNLWPFARTENLMSR